MANSRCFFLSFLSTAIVAILWYQYIRSLPSSSNVSGHASDDPGVLVNHYTSSTHEHLVSGSPALGLSSSQGGGPDVTAIVLNWSRFPNVVKIVSTLCDSSIRESVMAKIIVWNNNPNPISLDDFEEAECPTSKLTVYNSPSNLYFQARFLACASSKTPYCFVQDDDYLVLPEVLAALHSRIKDSDHRNSGIHLLPPHEHLTSTLRTSINNHLDLHTSFAWLGHGAMLHKSQVVEFLDLMKTLDVGDTAMKMADNYFTILSNSIPETWFDQGIELGGGYAFTVGAEGDERNRLHVTQAVEYLDKLLGTSLTPVETDAIPHASFKSTTPCKDRRCVLETNVSLLPESIHDSLSIHQAAAAHDMLELEFRRRSLLSPADEHLYLTSPPSNAVDNDPNTAFKSLHRARKNDSITLDLLKVQQFQQVELIFLVDPNTEKILSNAMIQHSIGHGSWISPSSVFSCSDAPHQGLRLCKFEFHSQKTNVGRTRYLKTVLTTDVLGEHWCIYEIYTKLTS